MLFSSWSSIAFSCTLDKIDKSRYWSKVLYSFCIAYFWFWTCVWPTNIWENFLFNKGIYYVDNCWSNLVHQRFKKLDRNIVVTAGTIVSTDQNNLLDFIVGGIVDGKCVRPCSEAAAYLIRLEVHFPFPRDLRQVL